jgi:hypothetical protein
MHHLEMCLPNRAGTRAFRPFYQGRGLLIAACPEHFPPEVRPHLWGLQAEDQEEAWLAAPLTPAERAIIDR